MHNQNCTQELSKIHVSNLQKSILDFHQLIHKLDCLADLIPVGDTSQPFIEDLNQNFKKAHIQMISAITALDLSPTLSTDESRGPAAQDSNLDSH